MWSDRSNSISMEAMASLKFLSHPNTGITVTIIFWTIIVLIVILSERRRVVGGKRKFHPIGGTMMNQLFHFRRLHHYMTDLARRYKTYRIIAPFRNEIFTADPSNVEYILKSNFLNYGKGTYNYMNLRDLLGDGIFAVDGEKWRQQRKVSSHEFSTKVLRDFSSVVFRKNASKVANIISDAAVSRQTFDIQDIFMKSTLDSIFKVAFGVELGTLCGSSNNNNQEGADFSNAFDTASALSLLRYVDPFWKLKKFLNVSSEAKLKEAVNIVDTFVYKLIRNELDVRNSKDYSPVKKDDILSRFLQEKGLDSDLKYLRDIILNFVIAGKDTTAATLAWFIYMMCKHPHIQERVAKEIEEQTSDHCTQRVTANPFLEFANCIREEALENMHYLHATLTETLRLYPTVPVDAKMCFSDDTLPDGFSVKKGDLVSYLPYAMGRMAFLWGNDAEEFKPERWLDEKGIFQSESPFKFTAFQAGPRICLGKEFAYRQMKIFSAVLLRHFVFKLGDEEKPVNYRTMINLQIDGGLHVRAFSRSST